MSIPKKSTVNCSKCGKPLSVTMFESINSDYKKNIAKQIMSGKLFNVKCPRCRTVSHLEYDTLYHDLRHEAMVWVVHPNTPECEEEITLIRTIEKPPYDTFRIVKDMNALKEKVSCFECKRDDRIVELCKVFVSYNLCSEQSDFKFKAAFYTVVRGKELIYLFDEEDNECYCYLSDKVYDYLEKLYYGSKYAAQFDNNYPIVDYEWAENILISLMKEKADKLSSSQKDENIEKNSNNEPIND